MLLLQPRLPHAFTTPWQLMTAGATAAAAAAAATPAQREEAHAATQFETHLPMLVAGFPDMGPNLQHLQDTVPPLTRLLFKDTGAWDGGRARGRARSRRCGPGCSTCERLHSR